MRTERGWGGHFCAAHQCYFRRNTLIGIGERRVVVSTIGNYKGTCEPIGSNRVYETMAFEASWDGQYWDADVSRPFYFQGRNGLPPGSNDNDAQLMHEQALDAVEFELEAPK